MNDDVKGLADDLVAELLRATEIWRRERDPEPLERVLRRMRVEECRKLNLPGTIAFTAEELAEHDARIRADAALRTKPRVPAQRVLPWWRP